MTSAHIFVKVCGTNIVEEKSVRFRSGDAVEVALHAPVSALYHRVAFMMTGGYESCRCSNAVARP